MENDKDLVTRLRWFNTNVQSDSPLIPPMQRIALEAADEIERLREALRGLLELVLAIQENNPALFLPSLNYNQRVMAAKDALLNTPSEGPSKTKLPASPDAGGGPIYSDEDMANVGRALMDRLPKGYSYSDCPTEIVSDLQNEKADLESELDQLRIDYDRACARVAELEDVHLNTTI